MAVTAMFCPDALSFCVRAVGNIPFGVTEDDLKAVFQDVGPIKNMR